MGFKEIQCFSEDPSAQGSSIVHELAGLICNAVPGCSAATPPLAWATWSIDPPCGASVAVSSTVTFAAVRTDFRFCFFAPIGNLLEAPQAQHFRTRTSAHGFRPFLLKFSTERRHVSPSMRGEQQILQIACLRSDESRICAFWATERRCEFS